MSLIHERSAAMPGMVSISVGAVAGIAVGGAIGLGVVLTFGYLFIARWRYKRELRLMGQIRQNRLQQMSQDVSPSFATARMFMSPRSIWNTLPSNESLRQEYLSDHQNDGSSRENRKEKRRSIFPPWPTSRKRLKGRKAAFDRMQQTRLSTVLETPQDVFGDSMTCLELSRRDAVHRLNGLERPESHSQDAAQCDHTPPRPSKFKAIVTKKRSPNVVGPSLRDESQMSDRSRISGNRSISLPSVAGSIVRDNQARERIKLQGQSRLRSNSAGATMFSMPPIQSPPPLPKPPPSAAERRASYMQRPSSRDSNSSIDSYSSSVLHLTSPHAKYVTDFSQRHPDLGLGAQIRGDLSEMRQALNEHSTRLKSKARDSGTRSPEKSSRASVRLIGECTALSENECTKDGIEDSHGPNSDAGHLEYNVPKTQRATSLERMSSLEAVSTPRRGENIGKVSADGSPAERRTTTSAMSKDDAYSTTIVRRSSDHSVLSSSDRSSTSNPFPWDDKPTPSDSNKGITEHSTEKKTGVLTSALKNSPNAKKHRRQNTVRISIQPTILGPPSSSGSFSNLLQIAEEVPEKLTENLEEDDVETHRMTKGGIPENLDSLSSTIFQPELKLKHGSHCASLTPSSPNFSLAHANQDARVTKPRFRTRQRSRSPTRQVSRPVSNNSNITVSAFPETPDFLFANLAAQPRDNTCHECFLDVSDLDVLPGLTLLNSEKTKDISSAEELLQYPTIDLEPRPLNIGLKIKSANSHRLDLQSNANQSVLTAIDSSRSRSWSPPPKSAPTTKLDSSTSPSLSTHPALQLPKTGASPTVPVLEPGKAISQQHPLGPRAALAADVIKSVRELRRMDSDTGSQSSMESSREQRRYRQLGRDSSPLRDDLTRHLTPDKDLGNATIFSSDMYLGKQMERHRKETAQQAEGKENMPATEISPVSSSEDSPDMRHSSDSYDDTSLTLGEERVLSPTHRHWLRRGNNEDSAIRYKGTEAESMNFTPGDLWDDDGFLIQEDSNMGVAL